MPSDLRSFRHKVAILKKQGVIAPGEVDARSIYPSKLYHGQAIKNVVEKYDAIASGKATAVKVPTGFLRKYRKAGSETVSGRVIAPHSEGEKAIFKPKQGGIVSVNKYGIQKVSIVMPYQSVESYFSTMEANAEKINATKTENEWFGFSMFGHNSMHYYANIQMLLEDLRKYQAFQNPLSRRSTEKILQNIQIFKLPARFSWPAKPKPVRNRAAQSAKKKRYRNRLKKRPTQYRKYLAGVADRMKTYRAKLKRSTRKYEAYLKASRARAAKSETKLHRQVLTQQKDVSKLLKKASKQLEIAQTKADVERLAQIDSIEKRINELKQEIAIGKWMEGKPKRRK